MNKAALDSEIYFIRHGETDWNQKQLIQGHTDIPLNAKGLLQAAELGHQFRDIPFSAAFSSDLSRARQTAETFFQSRPLPILPSSSLRERSAGAMEGLKKERFEKEIRPFLLSEKALNKNTYIQTPWHPELETMHSVFTRVTRYLFSMIATYPQKSTFAVFSHGGVLKSILDHLSFAPRQRWIVENCGFIKIKIEKETFELLDYYKISRKIIS